jgi:hypothetical protein
MRRRRGTLSKMTAVTRGPSSRSGQALETHTKFLQPQHQPAIPILAACHFAPASLTSTISGSSLWNGTGEMQRWKLAEQIAAGVLGGGGPWSNGAQATSRPHLRMSLWFRSVETWASLSGHRPPDAVLHPMPCRTSRNRTSVWRPRGGPKSAPPPTSTSFRTKLQNWNVKKWTHVCQRCWLSRLAVFIPCCSSKFGAYSLASIDYSSNNLCPEARLYLWAEQNFIIHSLLFDSAAKFGVAMENLF